MFPPQAANLNIEALSGICGSISIACWVVVFSPQIIENFRRGSADGLSLLFLIVWLAGDVFNILGAVLQGVLPTMIILAVYYTLADIVLLGQCFYYRGFNIRDEISPSSSPESGPVATGALDNEEGSSEAGAAPTERSALLPKSNGHVHIQEPAGNVSKGLSSRDNGHPTSSSSALVRRPSASSARHHVDGTHLSPATPFVDPSPDSAADQRRRRRITTIQTILFNATAIALVCAAGILGWWVSPGSKKSKSEPEPLTLDPLGQAFGYLCAVFYLGSRVPQLLLNYRRKSTDGVSLLFFLFACIGNLTYVLSIMAYSPVCQGTVSTNSENLLGEFSHRHRPHCRPGEAAALYGRYVLVNLSWLVGSFGTLLLDMAIFVQFFLYRDAKSLDEEYLGDE
ncbi:putative vacuolar amino acid transporter YPQ1 [Penicillium rolfsii]|nr:putative vacuolar amino acid transporter YPQ1 [Penicillium rolfsii]